MDWIIQIIKSIPLDSGQWLKLLQFISVLIAIVTVVLGIFLIKKTWDFVDFLKSFADSCLRELMKDATDVEKYNKVFVFFALIVFGVTLIAGLKYASQTSFNIVAVVAITAGTVFLCLFWGSPSMAMNVDRKKRLFQNDQ